VSQTLQKLLKNAKRWGILAAAKRQLKLFIFSFALQERVFEAGE
jgi:hypothetical protein